MVSKTRLNKEELQVLIDNVKKSGGDATELEGLMASVVDEERRSVRRQPLGVQPSAFGEGEVPLTSVGKYWDIYHSLQEPLELDEGASNLKLEIGNFAQKGGYSLDLNKSLEKHCIVMSRLKICPWAKESCICGEVKRGGRCKMGLLRK